MAVMTALQKRAIELEELCTDMYTYHNGDCYSCRYHEECKNRKDWLCIAPIRINERALALGIKVRPSEKVGV